MGIKEADCRYSREEHNKAVEMLKAGYTSRQISQAIGRERQSVISHLNRMGYYFREVPLQLTNEQHNMALDMANKNYSIANIAEKLGVGQYGLTSYLKRQGFKRFCGKKFWNKDRYDELVNLILEGKSIYEIADIFGKSENSIKQKMVLFFGTESVPKAKYAIEHSQVELYY